MPDARNNDYFNDTYRHNGDLKKYHGYSGDVFFDEALKWMDRSKKDRAPGRLCSGVAAVASQLRRVDPGGHPGT